MEKRESVVKVDEQVTGRATEGLKINEIDTRESTIHQLKTIVKVQFHLEKDFHNTNLEAQDEI